MEEFGAVLEREGESACSYRIFHGLFGAVTGGIITGWFTFHAQKQAADNQRRRDVEAERRATSGTLQAIAIELKILRADNLDPVAERLKELEQKREEALKNHLDSPPPLATIRTEQNYLIVFESSAGTIGRINDENLREISLGFMALLKIWQTNVNANSSREFAVWHRTSQGDPNRQLLMNMLDGLEEGIRHGLKELQRELAELLKEIETYVGNSTG